MALRVVTQAMASVEVRAWAINGLANAIPKWQKYVDEVHAEGGKANLADEMRLSAMRNADKSAVECRQASTKVFVALDRIYLQMAATPLWCVLAAAAGVLLRL